MATNGIRTSFWGPAAWAFFFSSIAGSYPTRVNKSDKSHLQIVRSYKQMFKSLEHTLPCIYCRQSYRKFAKELPIDEYTHSRESMLYWLYLIHDKVNQKLIVQEKACYESEKANLQGKSSTQRTLALKKLRTDILKTKPSPPFDRVKAMYEKQRAGCNPKTKQCS